MDKKYKRFLRDELNDEVGQIFTSEGKEYVLEGVIGDGAIGVVRKARDCKTGKQVAVKFLAPEFRYIEISSMEDIYARFRREGIRGVSLEHENLVKILSYQENENASCFVDRKGPCNPFVVMEFVRGSTLESFIRNQLPSPSFNLSPQTLHIAHQVAQALVYLHEKKIVHRDVKPANIFLSTITPGHVPSTVKLGDFGVVKWGDFKASMTSGTLTMSGHQGLGTFKYMSPEQATKPKDVTVRSDMYSFGITLYEAFTNQVLPSQHHVYQVTQARLMRGNTVSRLHELGLGFIPSRFDDLFSSILDMFLIGQKGRPSSQHMMGKLEVLLDRIKAAS